MNGPHKKITLVFSSDLERQLMLNGSRAAMCKPLLVNEVLNHINFDAFDNDFTMDYMADPRNFKIRDDINNTSDADTLHSSDVIVLISADKKTNNAIVLGFKPIIKGVNPTDTFNEMLKVSNLASSSLQLATGGFSGGVIAKHYTG